MPEPISSIEQVYQLHPELQDDVVHLKEWLTKQLHLPQVTDLQLVAFLTACENSLEATKTCIEAHFTLKADSQEFFKNRDPLGEDIVAISKVVRVAVLSSASPEGYRYVLMRLANPDVDVYFPGAAIKLFFMILDATFRHHPLTPGVILINDCSGFSFAHATKAFNLFRKYLVYLQDGLPIKVKMDHLMNSNPVVTSIIQLIRPFIKNENMELLACHSVGTESLYTHLSKKVMPREYGGQDDSLDELFERSLQEVLNNREWLLSEEEKCKIDETKREGGKSHGGDLLGTQGSFKRLEID